MSKPDIGDEGLVNEIMKIYVSSKLRPEVIFRSLITSATTVALLASNIDREQFLGVCEEIFDYWRDVKGAFKKGN